MKMSANYLVFVQLPRPPEIDYSFKWFGLLTSKYSQFRGRGHKSLAMEDSLQMTKLVLKNNDFDLNTRVKK